ncbi:hypothetical protein ABB37_00218 [Leptomonas pyrrhocoris]|uniref:Arrestin-like N-terminal domain-containing protein n=1 Tax=Leptomonas pyrrhocoris TaxID=157538 RepID=A0A0M9GAB5_LEPPY|nr:hypothetical protein ABB37_00218 [Leptomonas pyrrhocoris]KPA85906.1 hypothetical protein ABB37_00218 [Leptomonas pyrrhocoris]|eukprot:XP_015664345.1 hypothetical protein ABB37_00218 [Leptomonas pyrrhocoris]
MLPYRLGLKLKCDTVCLSDHVSGVVTVDVDPLLQEGYASPVAVRALVHGVEGSGDGGNVIEHVALITTLVGEHGSHEAAQAAAMQHSIAEFTTQEARNHPLLGVAVNPHDGDDEGGAAGERGGYVGLNSTAAASLQKTTASTPLEWVPGGHYEYPFTLQLPPWLPPSYCYKPGGGEADASMRYMVCAFVAEAAGCIPGPVDRAAADNSHNGLTRVLMDPQPGNGPRTNRSSGAAKVRSLLDEVAMPKNAKSDSVAPCRLLAEFQLPAEAGKLARCLEAGDQTKELVVLSAFPQREFLQCMERVAIPPPFSQKLTFHLYKHSLGLTGLAKAPFTDIHVRITYDSSAAVVLCGRPQSIERVRKALGMNTGPDGGVGNCPRPVSDCTGGRESVKFLGVPAGLTATGEVVFPAGVADVMPASGPPPAASSSAQLPSQVHAAVGAPSGQTSAGRIAARRSDPTSASQSALDGVLRLRVKVHAGFVSISKVRVDLFERVRRTDKSDSQKSVSYTLASYTYNKKIHANDTCMFGVELRLPKQFRRTMHDSNKLPPPAGITTPVICTTTWLQLTFPDLHAVPEQLLNENVVMVAEDVDLTDTVPFLPRSCGMMRCNTDTTKGV